MSTRNRISQYVLRGFDLHFSFQNLTATPDTTAHVGHKLFSFCFVNINNTESYLINSVHVNATQVLNYCVRIILNCVLL